MAAKGATFCIPPAKLGIVYAPKGIRRVARVVGLGRARSLFVSGRRVSSDEALAMGLVDAIGPDAEALTRELAANAPLAIAGMKKIFRAFERGEEPQVDALRRESFVSEDAREGVAALLQKRPPRFSGR